MAPDQEIDTNVVMRNYLEFHSRKDILEGILVYKIQRKHAKSDRLCQDESKQVQLLVAWRGEYTKGSHVRALLVEHSRRLDKDKLGRLYQKYWHLLKARVDPIGRNWLLDDATVLITTVNAMNRGYGWDIFISEGKYSIWRPLWIDVKR
jgi:hypothetical protein